MDDLINIIQIPDKDDEFAELQKEYSGILRDQMQKGNNGLQKKMYITFSLEAESPQAARLKLERVESAIINNFKILGCRSKPLDGYERLEVMHDIFNMGSKRKLNFNWDLVAETGLTTKNFIVPDSFDFTQKFEFPIGKKYGSASYLQINAPELPDIILSEFFNMDSNILINIHVKSVPQRDALKRIQNTISDIDKMIITEQMRANRSGYDMDILPPELRTSSEEAKTLLTNLQQRNEKMFMVTFIVINIGEKKEGLENNVSTARSIAQQYNCELRPLDWQQEDALMSSIPIGLNSIDITRALTSSSSAIFIPFTTQELYQREGSYYGLNAQSNNIIMADRKALKTPNGLFLGTPGSGKSFSSKREIVDVLIRTTDDILIVDPEREYSSFVEAFYGQVIRISADSPDHINPMDINLSYTNKDDDNYDPFKTKSNFILSLCEQIMGGRDGLGPQERSIIDRCVIETYEEYRKDPNPEKMPILQDLYESLNRQDNPEAKNIAVALELYVKGSLNIFNHQTNVNIQNRIVCFDIKDLESNLKTLGMLIMQDQVWSRVTINRGQKKTTRYYIDEFHLLLREEQTAAASIEIWKRFRKWGGVPTGITQNVTDFLASRQINNIFSNSDFIYLLNQSPDDQEFLAKSLRISNHQLSYVSNAPAGSGLLFYGGVIIPFIDRFPTDTKLYKLMTTRLEETEKPD